MIYMYMYTYKQVIQAIQAMCTATVVVFKLILIAFINWHFENSLKTCRGKKYLNTTTVLLLPIVVFKLKLIAFMNWHFENSLQTYTGKRYLNTTTMLL